MEDIKEHQNHEKIEDAGFRSCASASEPRWPRQRSAREVSGENDAAVRDGVEKSLSKIETRVHADREPNRACAAQRETPKQATQDYSEDSGRRFTRIRPLAGAQ